MDSVTGIPNMELHLSLHVFFLQFVYSSIFMLISLSYGINRIVKNWLLVFIKVVLWNFGCFLCEVALGMQSGTS